MLGLLYLNDKWINPDNKVHGANMGPIWGREDPGGPHVGPMNFDIWEVIRTIISAARDIVMLRVDKFPYPRQKTRGN